MNWVNGVKGGKGGQVVVDSGPTVLLDVNKKPDGRFLSSLGSVTVAMGDGRSRKNLNNVVFTDSYVVRPMLVPFFEDRVVEMAVTQAFKVAEEEDSEYSIASGFYVDMDVSHEFHSACMVLLAKRQPEKLASGLGASLARLYGRVVSGNELKILLACIVAAGASAHAYYARQYEIDLEEAKAAFARRETLFELEDARAEAANSWLGQAGNTVFEAFFNLVSVPQRGTMPTAFSTGDNLGCGSKPNLPPLPAGGGVLNGISSWFGLGSGTSNVAKEYWREYLSGLPRILTIAHCLKGYSDFALLPERGKGPAIEALSAELVQSLGTTSETEVFIELLKICCSLDVDAPKLVRAGVAVCERDGCQELTAFKRRVERNVFDAQSFADKLGETVEVDVDLASAAELLENLDETTPDTCTPDLDSRVDKFLLAVLEKQPLTFPAIFGLGPRAIRD